MGSIIIVSSLTLVEGHALLNRVAGSGRSQPSEEGPVSPLSIAKSKEKLL
jgi:hypothetical protein